MADEKAFTGRTRVQRTRWTVHLADRVSKLLITFGGIGTIVAVCTVCVFLLWVAKDLFRPAVAGTGELRRASWSGAAPLAVGMDEYLVMGWAVLPDGTLHTFRLDTGEPLGEQQLFPYAAPTVFAFGVGNDQVAVGFADGTVRLGRLGFDTSFPDPESVPPQLRSLARDERAEFQGGMVQLTPERQLRLQQVSCSFGDPIPTGSTAAVELLDYTEAPSGPIFCALTGDGVLRLRILRTRMNWMTGKEELRPSGTDLEIDPARGGSGPPAWLRLSGLGDCVYLAWPDGSLSRYDTRRLDQCGLAESRDLVPAATARMTCLDFVLGKNSLVCGDSDGRLEVWFRMRPGEATTSDGTVFLPVRELSPGGTAAAITCLASSARSRLLAVGRADGSLEVYQTTTGGRLLHVSSAPGGHPLEAVAISPRDDALLAVAGSEVRHWRFEPMHPEATLASLFLPVWYEGYEEQAHIWQSSSATDDSEMKLGLIPLIFGTLKATFYSMLFGVPIALLAAVYTSEFLHPTIRARIKPVIELMASLPSVVLGFLAALVFAPLVERAVPAILICFVAVPLAFMLGAHLWQLLPRQATLRLQAIGQQPTRQPGWARRCFGGLVRSVGGVRMLLLLACLIGGIAGARVAGPVMEHLLFAGDVTRWLDGQIGSATGAWVLMLLPLVALVVIVLMIRLLGPWLRELSVHRSRFTIALLDLLRFGIGIVLTCGLTLACAWAMTALGFDPRTGTDLVGVDLSPLSTYVQRNALVVGFAMGFAVIPIIYTLAEDALAAVPEHLRSASLGAGATPWQTAIRIIVPTAMSGLFSAVMIGLGRAVGETMIVLMAAGNTPVLEMNVFNGFRTLSANIAVEMPEAVKDSTHYRTLFLAAVTLFAMTFVVNTVAEIVRLRFRKRAFQL